MKDMAARTESIYIGMEFPRAGTDVALFSVAILDASTGAGVAVLVVDKEELELFEEFELFEDDELKFEEGVWAGSIKVFAMMNPSA